MPPARVLVAPGAALRMVAWPLATMGLAMVTPSAGRSSALPTLLASKVTGPVPRQPVSLAWM
jgi:phosphoribosylcarboxyaminoimidazole (NCAIR) mutase